MKKIFIPKVMALFFLMANTFFANAQKKKNSHLKKIIIQKVKKISPLDSLTNLLKGNLVLPFEGCNISMPYGLCKMESNTIYQNPGITFSAKASKKVRAAWDGVVSRISIIDDMYVVIIRCGQLFFAYANLEKPMVAVNQHLSKGQFIGNLHRDDTGYFSTDFLLSAKDQINPTNWFDWNGSKNMIMARK
ncbi:MAG: M23 family metallopeptidase [Ferruginibacter sp.]